MAAADVVRVEELVANPPDAVEEDAGLMRVPLEAPTIDLVEQSDHLRFVVDVLGEDVFGRGAARRAVDVEDPPVLFAVHLGAALQEARPASDRLPVRDWLGQLR